MPAAFQLRLETLFYCVCVFTMYTVVVLVEIVVYFGEGVVGKIFQNFRAIFPWCVGVKLFRHRVILSECMVLIIMV